MANEPLERCPNCGEPVDDTYNFCRGCAIKLKEVCNCWVKKGSYNCGMSRCPGWELWIIEMRKAKEEEFS